MSKRKQTATVVEEQAEDASQQASLEEACEPVEEYGDREAEKYEALQDSAVPQCVAEPSMAPQWPAKPFNINWPWGSEPNPQIGDIVGYNWQEQEVAVVTAQPMIQNSEPWTVTISIKPMHDNWKMAHVIDLDTSERYKHVLWYTKWNRAGLRECSEPSAEPVPFGGRCLVAMG